MLLTVLLFLHLSHSYLLVIFSLTLFFSYRVHLKLALLAVVFPCVLQIIILKNKKNIAHDRGILMHTIETCPFHLIETASLNYARRLLVQTCCCTQKKRRFWSGDSDSSTRKSVDRQVGVANFTRKLRVGISLCKLILRIISDHSTSLYV